MDQGNIVLLNGTSSAGKTSIAKALQDLMETPYLHTGTDHFLPRVPSKYFVVSDGLHPATAEYFLLVYPAGTPRAVADREGGATVYSQGVLTEVRIGPGGLKLLAGMYRSIAALAEAGIDVIVDAVIYDRRELKAAVEALAGCCVLFVGLKLPRAVAEQRERERGDRGPGGAMAFYDLVHARAIYDLELDTSLMSPLECAQRIKQTLQQEPPRAFRELFQVLS